MVSAKFTPAASTSTSTWPGPGTGSGTSRTTSTSGPPNSVTWIARTSAPSRRPGRTPPSRYARRAGGSGHPRASSDARRARSSPPVVAVTWREPQRCSRVLVPRVAHLLPALGRVADRRQAARRAQHPGGVHEVPGHVGGVAVREVVVVADRHVGSGQQVAVARPGTRLTDPAAVRLGRHHVADVLEGVEEVHRAVL